MNWRLLTLSSILLVLYGALFPFHFDFSSFSWARFSLFPFWDVERGRIHSLPDMVSNVLLTMPLGFFGVMWLGRKKKYVIVCFLLGLGLGLFAEVIQLAIPSRLSDITDTLNNGLGALAGSVCACLFGKSISELLSGALFDTKHTFLCILLGIIAAGMLLPFDFTMDISHIGSSLRMLWANPWERGTSVQDEWVQMAEFAILGALAGLIGRYRLSMMALALPFILEPMQFLVESHAPSVRDLAMNLAGVSIGIALARLKPSWANPATGFILMNVAIIAQGLSPYHLGGKSPFEWVPLVEYYRQTTGAALYDALSGILTFGLLAALRPRKTTILWAVLLAAFVEYAQTFLPGRSAGVTDVLIAGIGAWLGLQLARITRNSKLGVLQPMPQEGSW